MPTTQSQPQDFWQLFFLQYSATGPSRCKEYVEQAKPRQSQVPGSLDFQCNLKAPHFSVKWKTPPRMIVERWNKKKVKRPAAQMLKRVKGGLFFDENGSLPRNFLKKKTTCSPPGKVFGKVVLCGIVNFRRCVGVPKR